VSRLLPPRETNPTECNSDLRIYCCTGFWNAYFFFTIGRRDEFYTFKRDVLAFNVVTHFLCLYIYNRDIKFVTNCSINPLMPSGYCMSVRGSNPGGGEIFRTRPDRPYRMEQIIIGNSPKIIGFLYLENLNKFPGNLTLRIMLKENPKWSCR
jgi:hypothetical protein